MYRTLEPDKIVATLAQLVRRIRERFPGSSLSRVCDELLTFAGESRARTDRIARPNRALRSTSALVILSGIAALAYVARLINIHGANTELFGMLQGIEATVNLSIVVGAAVLFLTTLEGRAKRREALGDLHQARQPGAGAAPMQPAAAASAKVP